MRHYQQPHSQRLVMFAVRFSSGCWAEEEVRRRSSPNFFGQDQHENAASTFQFEQVLDHVNQVVHGNACAAPSKSNDEARTIARNAGMARASKINFQYLKKAVAKVENLNLKLQRPNVSTS